MNSGPRQTHTLNEFGFIDRQQPLNQQQDMRTSMYMGTKYISDNVLGNAISMKCKETRPYYEDVELAKHRNNTDYKANFVWKFGDSDEVHNPTLNNMDNIKPFYECKMKFLKRPMLPASSVSRTDYLWHPNVPREAPAKWSLPTPVIASKVSIDRSKPGYSKYLDPSATTSRLEYCHRTPQDIMSGIAAKDNITFWNWKNIEKRTKKVFSEKDPEQCDALPTTECVKRRCEYPSLVKAVPNNGMTTEVRDNYVEPKSIEYDITCIKNKATYKALDPFAKKSEYNILGSGECTQKYV